MCTHYGDVKGGTALSDQVRHVHGHLLDLRVVELLDVAEVAHIALGEEVDRDTLAAEAAAAADSVNVVLRVEEEERGETLLRGRASRARGLARETAPTSRFVGRS